MPSAPSRLGCTAACLTALLTVASTALAQPRREFVEVHMGVPVRFVLHAPNDSAARAAARASFTRIEELENKMSDYRAESEVRRLEAHVGKWSPVSPELFAVLSRAIEIARMSEGAFDPTVGPLVGLWREARRTGRLPARGALDSARLRVGWQKLALDSARRTVRLGADGMRIDLGGIAKGYILQEALTVLVAHGVPRAMLEAGGDVVVGDAPPGRSGWHIDVPGADSLLFRMASTLTNAAISTSGPTQQYVDIEGLRYSHVVDPRTGYGLTNAYTATVIAADGATADALATALTVLGPERGVELLTRVGGGVIGCLVR